MKPGQNIHVDIFTEDTAKNAFLVIKNILKSLFQHIVPDCQTQRILFYPQSAKSEKARSAISALHLWKSGRDIPRFAKELASLLSQGHYVFYHLDSDHPWNHPYRSDTIRKFIDNVLPSVWSILTHKDQAHLVGQHLFLLVPCRGIESWLFRDYSQVLSLCRVRCQRLSGGAACQCEALVNDWISRHTDQDHLLEGGPPSRALPTPEDPTGHNDCPKKKLCFGAEHNGALSENFSNIFDELYVLERSLYGSVKFIERNQALKQALNTTQDDWTPPPHDPN